jgi:hypothetical protein
MSLQIIARASVLISIRKKFLELFNLNLAFGRLKRKVLETNSNVREIDIEFFHITITNIKTIWDVSIIPDDIKGCAECCNQ